LDTVDELVTGFAGDVGVGCLGEEWDDSDTGVATDNGDVLILRIGSLDL